METKGPLPDILYDKESLIEYSLETGAIKLDPDNPFTWASGAKMPIYNDNRLLLGSYQIRMMVGVGFQTILQHNKIQVDGVAGTATAGIAPAATLANLIKTPLAYIRPEPKKHGMQNQIEGALPEKSRIIVIEDLVSTGGSSLKAVQALRKEGFKVDHCLCIFNYGFLRAAKSFQEQDCKLHSLLTFPQLLDYCKKTNRFGPVRIKLLEAWEQDPFNWHPQK